MMTNVFQNSKSFSSIQHTTAVVSYNIFIMNWNCKYACDATKMEANLNLDSSKLFFLLESKLRFDSILVAKQAYAIDNEQGKLNRAESYKAT